MMNFFINQGRCRVCGKMLCCIDHQKEHEIVYHKEYAYILEKLPVLCKKCHRVIYFIHDLHLGCHPFMNHHLMNGDFYHSAVSFAKSNRKRPLKDTEEANIPAKNYFTLPNEQRKKLVPAHKFKGTDLKNFLANAADTSQMLVIGFNQIIMDSKSIFSPQLNMSYKMLIDSVVKSSTPLNEQENENSPIQNDILHQTDKSTYSTPEIVQSSILIISTKKNTPPGIISNFPKRLSKSAVKNRKVTFEVIKTPEIENNISVYGTPPTTMKISDELKKNVDISLNIPQSPPGCFLVKIVKRMRTAIHRIPRSISTAWGWRGQKFQKSNSTEDDINCDIRSPLKKRIKYNSDDFLTRKPISSYWVNMSVNSMFRKPLPNYVRRYHNSIESYHE